MRTNAARRRVPRSTLCWRAACAWLGLLACQREPALELLEVNRVAASEVQFGDTLSVLGDGFALGKPVQVHLRGRVHRAGVPARDVEVALAARAESQHELSVPLTEDAEHELCGASAPCAHLTFRGDLQVAIAASEPGAPPVIGTLHGSTLELYPSLEARAQSEERTALGQHALGFFGLQVSIARQGGLLVGSVLPEGRAAAAGIEPGDRIVRSGGLSVREPSDLVPEQSRTLDVGVYRTGAPRSLVLDADGFHAAPPRGFGLAALGVAVAALAFVLWASPLARWLAALSPRWLERARERYGAGAARRRSRWRLAWEPLGGRLGTLVWLAVGAALLAPALRRTAIDLGLGLLALASGSATLLLATALIEGGRRASGWSLRRGLRRAVQQLLVSAPAWIGLVAISLEHGVDADEWVRAQGALPWDWNAFADPGSSLLFVAMLLTALPQRPLPHGGRSRQLRDAGVGPATSLLGALYGWSLCALGALAFLGGGAGFAAPAGLDAAGGASRLLASLLVWVKFAGLSALLAWLRGLTQRLTLEHWVPVGLSLVLPGSLLAVLLGQAWRALEGRSAFWRWLLSGFGPLLVAALALALPATLWGVRRALRSSQRFLGLSPWL